MKASGIEPGRCSVAPVHLPLSQLCRETFLREAEKVRYVDPESLLMEGCHKPFLGLSFLTAKK